VGKKKPARTIPTAESLLADTQKLFDVMNSASDLAVAIVAHSYLDASLGCLLRHRFVDSDAARDLLDDMNGQLSSFGARCRAARALGLISALWYADLRKLGKIRNRFAHHYLALDFGDKQIGTLCDSLSLNKDPINVATGKPMKVPHISEAHRIRGRYLMMSVHLSQKLLQQVAAGPPRAGRSLGVNRTI
jgi:DNA-binding MltR family transcriptional regulator